MGNEELRKKNRETIEKFIQCRGPERGILRAPLFIKDATQEIAMPVENGFEYRVTPVQEWLDSTAVSFPDWGFYDNIIFETEDPDIFLVKSHGKGTMVQNGKPVPVEHYYINEFRMENGKIKMFRETPNPCEEFNPYKML